MTPEEREATNWGEWDATQRLVIEARDSYFFLNNAWQIARAEESIGAERLERAADRAWERMLRRGKTLSAIRMQQVLS